ncbi:hypothetical protein XELAEV_180142562mg, partial [Xenopus laevis]
MGKCDWRTVLEKTALLLSIITSFRVSSNHLSDNQ